MTELRKLPIGIEDFEKIRQEDFYYVDLQKKEHSFLQLPIRLFYQVYQMQTSIVLTMGEFIYANMKKQRVIK